MASQSFDVNAPITQVWAALFDVLPEYGRITNSNESTHRLEFRSNALMDNFATATITLKSRGRRTEVHLTGHAMEGLLNMGYADKLLDRLSFAISEHFDEPRDTAHHEHREDYTPFIVLGVIIAILVLLVLFAF